MDYRQMSGDLTLKCVPFDQLDSYSLYDLLALRSSVFCVEQNCAYQDLDGKDITAWHVLAYRQGSLVGTTRILMPGESYSEACSIGRVASHVDHRGMRIGHRLMEFSVNQCITLFPSYPIRISAQQYLTHFYQSFGFVEGGEPYLEDGLPHIAMERAVAGSE